MNLWKAVGKMGIVTALALMAVSTASAKKYNIRWVLIHEPSDVVEQAAKDFAARLDKRTGGDLHVEVLTRSEYKSKYNKGETISQKAALDAVEAGQLEMCQAYTHTIGLRDNQLWVLDMPYLFRDYEHAERVIEGPIGAKLRKSVQDSMNLQALAITYSGGFGVFATTGREIHKPSDMSRLRTMVPNTPVFRNMAVALNLEPLVVPAEGFVPLAEKDLVDAHETTPARFEELQEFRAAKVLVNTNHFMLTSMVVMNKNFLASLPENYRKIIQEEILETARFERRRSIEANREALGRMAQRGVKVIDLTAAEKEAFVAALQPVYSKVGRLVGDDVVTAIRETKSGSVTARR